MFLDKINREEITLYLSFYVEAANRDAFMAGERATSAAVAAAAACWGVVGGHVGFFLP